MARFNGETLKIVKRLQNARLSLLAKQPFYALLLMHMKFALDPSCETAYTDGERIAFNLDYLNRLSDSELEFVLMHEILHAALGHPFRMQADYDLKIYDLACDIIVNSNILYSFGMDKRKITIKDIGEAVHQLPNGDEGYKYTLEQVYDILMSASGKQKPKKNPNANGAGASNVQSGDASDACDNDDNDSHEDGDENDSSADNDSDDGGENDDGDEDGNSSKSKSKKQKGGKGGKSKGKGGQSENTDGGAGRNGSISESDLKNLKNMLKSNIAAKSKLKSAELADKTNGEDPQETQVDDHSFWEGDDEVSTQQNTWLTRMVEATEIVSSQGGKSRGTIPKASERIVEELKNPILDWRTILNDFVQEEINDYSFSPPDKRMDDCPFFLPDFNEKDEKVKDVLFMIDTSGSMSDCAITQCYSEIYGAIQQFGGKLQGMLGFFDAVVVEPIPFEDEDEFKIIRPKGGGGTSFDVIFEYVEKQLETEPPTSIIILTDGFAPFPDEERANGIPVLWIINNDIANPPWGKVARLIDPNAPKSVH